MQESVQYVLEERFNGRRAGPIAAFGGNRAGEQYKGKSRYVGRSASTGWTPSRGLSALTRSPLYFPLSFAAAVSATPAPSDSKDSNGPLNDRQRWVLAELSKGVELRRADVEKQFRVCPRTVKRDMADLAERGLLEYLQSPRPGHYRIRQR